MLVLMASVAVVMSVMALLRDFRIGLDRHRREVGSRLRTFGPSWLGIRNGSAGSRW